jgi:hypothetical protein
MFLRDIFIRQHRQDDERYLDRFSQRLSDEATLKELLKTMKGDVAEVLRVAHHSQGMCNLFLAPLRRTFKLHVVYLLQEWHNQI